MGITPTITGDKWGIHAGAWQRNVDTINQYWIWLCLPNGVYIYIYIQKNFNGKEESEIFRNHPLCGSLSSDKPNFSNAVNVNCPCLLVVLPNLVWLNHPWLSSWYGLFSSVCWSNSPFFQKDYIRLKPFYRVHSRFSWFNISFNIMQQFYHSSIHVITGRIHQVLLVKCQLFAFKPKVFQLAPTSASFLGQIYFSCHRTTILAQFCWYLPSPNYSSKDSAR